MKKLVNLIALVVLVSTNALTPFSYAQEALSEVIPENEVKNVVETGETPEYIEEFPENTQDNLGELEQENQDDVAPEDVLPNIQDDEETPATDETEKIDTENQDLQKPEEFSTMDITVNPMDIVIEAISTEENQTIKINKYFKSDYTVDRGNGSGAIKVTSDTTYTYTTTGVHNITLSLTGTSTRWTFNKSSKPLVPIDGTTMTGVKIVSMPSLEDGFGNSATAPGDYFFYDFNYGGKLIDLPIGSFDTSGITTPGLSFFSYFNQEGQLTQLPESSFKLSTGITTVGNNFFRSFNDKGQLKSLPEGSFDTSNIITVGNFFFYGFNWSGQMVTLPDNSFNTSKITSVGTWFFGNFNRNGSLIELPEKSFDISHIESVGDYFFVDFNNDGQITYLPEGSFRFSSGLVSVGNHFFFAFNSDGQITNLPEGSFNTSNIITAGDYFFRQFNVYGSIKSLPEGSFNFKNLKTVGDYAFRYFNGYGAITNLPKGSFDTPNIITVGTNFFAYFNYDGAITNLLNSFTINSTGLSNTNGYQNAFNSPDYTINRKVSDLVSGVTAPLGDRNVFSDNQPGRCGVHENWLVSKADACHIIYDANGGEGTTTGGYESDATIVEVGTGITLPTRVGYSFSGWQDASGNNIAEVMFPAMDGQTLYANWTPNEYTITFEDSSEENEKIVISGLYLSDTSSIKYPKWTKEGYKIVWDKEIPATMPAENMVIKSSWEKNGYSGGGGGGGSSKKTDEDTHGSAEDSQKNTQDDKNTENVIQNETKGSEEASNIPVDSSDKSAEGQEMLSPSDLPSSAGQVSFTKEQKDAYAFAKENGITTMPTIQKADMSGKLTRIQMAKMLSQYAINVLGQTPDTSKTIKFRDVTSKKDADYDNGVTLAYQLGIMGQNMPNNKFRPNDEVSRAEFATALSRLLYQTTDGEYKSTKEYYIPHMAKLYNEGIISNTDPSMAERRGYVMIMLMRSAK